MQGTRRALVFNAIYVWLNGSAVVWLALLLSYSVFSLAKRIRHGIGPLH
jgi:hypothetical protein